MADELNRNNETNEPEEDVTALEEGDIIEMIGDELEVKVCEIDAQGRINLIRNDIVYSAPEFTRREGGNRRPPRRSENSNHD